MGEEYRAFREKGNLLQSPEKEIGKGILTAPGGSGHQQFVVSSFFSQRQPVKINHIQHLEVFFAKSRRIIRNPPGSSIIAQYAQFLNRDFSPDPTKMEEGCGRRSVSFPEAGGTNIGRTRLGHYRVAMSVRQIGIKLTIDNGQWTMDN